MEDHRKFVLVGAGSSSFTAAVLSGLIRSGRWRGTTLALVDTDAEKLRIVEKLVRKIVEQEDAAITVAAGTDRTELLEGADYVTTTISVGGDEAWQADLEIPAEHGVIQPVGDTVGIGGMSRAFRHAPVLVEIARDMERLCPDAVLFNYTNPMTVNCRAVTRETEIECVGLCIGCELLRRDISRILAVDTAETWMWAGGINHFSFAYRVRLDGRDAYPLLGARLRQARGDTPEEGLAELIARFPSSNADPEEPCEDRNPFCSELYEHTGYYPGPGDRHVAEFLPHFFRTPEDLRAYELDLFDIEAKKEGTTRFLEKFREAADSEGPLDVEELIGGTSGEEAQVLEIIDAVNTGSGRMFFVNLPNRGQIANLPGGEVVEGPAVATADGLKPLVLGEMPEPIRSWTYRWLEWGEMVVDAALSGDHDKALHCLAADPGCTGLSKSLAILDELLEANGRYMAEFTAG